MIRKLTCLQIHNDYQIPGGETKTAKAIADLLEENGIDVIRYYRSNKEFQNVCTLKKIYIGISSVYNRKTEKDIERIISKNKIDFALVHNTMPLISNSVFKVLFENDIPVIKYIQNYYLVCINGSLDHSAACEICKRNHFNGVKNKCYKNSYIYSFVKYISKLIFDKKYRDNIAAYMPNSKFVMEKHAVFGMSTKNMHVMYNYIDNEINDIEIDTYRSYYLYFGRLSKGKGVNTTIEAFKNLPKYSLLIMGSGELEDEVLDKIKYINNITYVGSKSGEELNLIIRNAKCVIVPSEWDEPLPRTILEAYAQGVPVIGSDKGGIPEMIDLDQTGLVFESTNVVDLIKKIEKLEAINLEQYKSMKKLCLNKVSSQYTRKEYFARFKQCIDTVL